MFVDPRKLLRFPALYKRDGPIIICPFDDYLIAGPVNGLDKSHAKLHSIISARPTAVLAFAGTIVQHAEDFVATPFILNLSASTTRSQYTQKVRIGSLDTALSFNASRSCQFVVQVRSNDARACWRSS